MRLVTRSDFDGLVCAVLLKERGLITEYKFAHPKDLQDGFGLELWVLGDGKFRPSHSSHESVLQECFI